MGWMLCTKFPFCLPWPSQLATLPLTSVKPKKVEWDTMHFSWEAGSLLVACICERLRLVWPKKQGVVLLIRPDVIGGVSTTRTRSLRSFNWRIRVLKKPSRDTNQGRGSEIWWEICHNRRKRNTAFFHKRSRACQDICVIAVPVARGVMVSFFLSITIHSLWLVRQPWASYAHTCLGMLTKVSILWFSRIWLGISAATHYVDSCKLLCLMQQLLTRIQEARNEQSYLRIRCTA
jgi:hypothetical protein